MIKLSHKDESTSFMTNHRVLRATRRVSLVEQELFPFRSTRVFFSGVRVAQSLWFSVYCFVDHCLSNWLFGHCIICPSIYDFWSQALVAWNCIPFSNFLCLYIYYPRWKYDQKSDICKTWLIVMEYQCHKWPRISSTCRKRFPVLSSFTTWHCVCN